MHQAAAEGAAGADRVMRDVAHHARQQPSERALGDRPIECRMPHAGPDRELAVLGADMIELRDAVDVDQMGGAGEAKRHGGNQALSARQHPPVRGRDLRQHGHRLGPRSWAHDIEMAQVSWAFTGRTG